MSGAAALETAEFARAMVPVARELMGEPSEESERELRFGSRGSLSIDPSAGTWYDHEAGKGGGVIAFVVDRKRTDKAGAVAWLRERGYIPQAGPPKAARRQVAAYDYQDEAGELLFQVIRFEPKDFRQRARVGNGWAWKMTGVRRVLYRLPEVVTAVAAGQVIYIVEGEKAADAMSRFGLVATCSPGGANKWRAEYGTPLIGADVILLPDNDEPGRQHATAVARALLGIAQTVRTLTLPGLPDKGDAADWISAGGSLADLLKLTALIGSNGADHAEAPFTADNTYSTNAPYANGHEAAALTDDGVITEGSVADAFARAHRDALRFDHDLGCWFHWDGATWRRERTELAYRWAHQRARDLAATADNAKAIISAGKASFAAGVERLAQSDRVFAVTSEIWDADPWLLGTPRGTVDLKTGELRPAQQGDFITKQTAATSAQTPDCTMWLEFLDQACGGDVKYIRFLQQWSGYCLTGSVREHAFLLIHGSGGNGKSVWLNTVANIIGDYSVIAAMDTFIASKGDRHPTDLAALRGARMVCASETEEGRQWSEARIKQLTGGDKIAARFMRQDFFEYTPNFKLTMSANHQPELRNVDDAVRRRVRMGPFLNKPATPDTNLEEKLRAEWPGILRWMIDGCLDWQVNGLICPDVVTASTAEYFDDQDLLTQWIEECCDRTDHNGLPVADTLASLIASWRGFAKGRGEEFSGSKGFSSALQKRGFSRIKDKHGIRGRGILGMRVRFDPPPPDTYGGG